MDIFVLDTIYLFFGKKMTLFAKGGRNTEIHEIC